MDLLRTNSPYAVHPEHRAGNRGVRRDDQQPGAADSNAHRPAQRVQTLQKPVRRSQSGPALGGKAIEGGSAENRTRANPHAARRYGECRGSVFWLITDNYSQLFSFLNNPRPEKLL